MQCSDITIQRVNIIEIIDNCQAHFLFVDIKGSVGLSPVQRLVRVGCSNLGSVVG